MNDLDSLLKEMEGPSSSPLRTQRKNTTGSNPAGSPLAGRSGSASGRSNSTRLAPGPGKALAAASGYAAARAGSASAALPSSSSPLAANLPTTSASSSPSSSTAGSPAQNTMSGAPLSNSPPPPNSNSTPMKKMEKPGSTAASRLDALISSLNDFETTQAAPAPAAGRKRAGSTARRNHPSMAELDNEVEALEKELKAVETARAKSTGTKRIPSLVQQQDASRTNSLSSNASANAGRELASSPPSHYGARSPPTKPGNLHGSQPRVESNLKHSVPPSPPDTPLAGASPDSKPSDDAAPPAPMPAASIPPVPSSSTTPDGGRRANHPSTHSIVQSYADDLPNYDDMSTSAGPGAAARAVSPLPEKAVCATCSGLIVNGPIVTALGRSWHPHHFVCSGCESVLAPESFFEREDEPFCETCFKGVFAATCAYCDGVITEGCITALNATWHPHHFFCSCCGKLFPPGAGFLEKDGKAYCEDDYFSLFSTLCAGCNRPVVGEYVSAVEREWHPECFTCMDCDAPFPTGVFFEHQGQPFCETHYEQRLAAVTVHTNTASNQVPPTPQTPSNPHLPAFPPTGAGSPPSSNPYASARGGSVTSVNSSAGQPPLRTCPTCQFEVAPRTPGVVVDPTTGARFHPTHYVCAVCKMTTEGGILLRMGPDGRELEGGRTKGIRVAARGPDGLVCERCIGRP
ncbi:hypothetical protein HDU96_005033 [Phlyctochytrium bullatum]|nr:hypothetical protein HDU96_005033 [Phlyctochytrium bullatum]